MWISVPYSRSIPGPAFLFLFQMLQFNVDAVLFPQVSGQLVGGIYRAVLPTGTPEIDLKMGETPIDIILNGFVDNPEYIVEKVVDIAVVAQEIDNRLIAAG